MLITHSFQLNGKIGFARAGHTGQDDTNIHSTQDVTFCRRKRHKRCALVVGGRQNAITSNRATPWPVCLIAQSQWSPYHNAVVGALLSVTAAATFFRAASSVADSVVRPRSTRADDAPGLDGHPRSGHGYQSCRCGVTTWRRYRPEYWHYRFGERLPPDSGNSGSAAGGPPAAPAGSAARRGRAWHGG